MLCSVGLGGQSLVLMEVLDHSSVVVETIVDLAELLGLEFGFREHLG